jgi:hypothetical protein
MRPAFRSPSSPSPAAITRIVVRPPPPGLIDMHVHLTSLAEIGGYQGLKYTDSFWSAVGVGNAGRRSTPASPRCATSAARFRRMSG